MFNVSVVKEEDNRQKTKENKCNQCNTAVNYESVLHINHSAHSVAQGGNIMTTTVAREQQRSHSKQHANESGE